MIDVVQERHMTDDFKAPFFFLFFLLGCPEAIDPTRAHTLT